MDHSLVHLVVAVDLLLAVDQVVQYLAHQYYLGDKVMMVEIVDQHQEVVVVVAVAVREPLVVNLQEIKMVVLEEMV